MNNEKTINEISKNIELFGHFIHTSFIKAFDKIERLNKNLNKNTTRFEASIYAL